MSLFSVTDMKDFARLLAPSGKGTDDDQNDSDLEEMAKNRTNIPEKSSINPPIDAKSSIKPQSDAKTPKDMTSKSKSTEIWTESEVEVAGQENEIVDFIDFSSDPRSCPHYTMTLSQTVSPEDIFLQMGEKTPLSHDSIKVEVTLPGEDFHKIKLDIKKTSVCLTSPKYCLFLNLPHNVDPNAGSAKWFSEKSNLQVNLKILVEN